jgi:GT2 family glycosyltransferase/SAM-dependent methyltransferase
MERSIPFLSETKVLALLPEQYGQANSLFVEELSASSGNPKVRKRFYHLFIEGGIDLHLTCGFDLKQTYERAKAFHAKLPKLTCEPVFLSEDKEFDLFGQEFFAGQPIDESLVSGRTSEQEVTEILEKLRIALESLEADSSEAAIHSELDDFGKLLMQNKFLGDVDRAIINESLLPYLREKSASFIPTIRWSNGDMAARNIILSEDGDFRIIDCEFAHQTHFFDEDWVRLSRYSHPQFSSLPFFEKRLEKSMEFFWPYFWLRQALLDLQVHEKESCPDFLKVNLSNACLGANFDSSSKNDFSLILSGIANHFRQVERKHFVECHGRLDAELSNVELDSRINRIQDSASWKTTAPLRFLRRKFVDPKKESDRKAQKDGTEQTRKKGLGPTKLYRKWISKHDRFGSGDYKTAKKELAGLKTKPLFSIVLPVFDPEENHLRATIDSVFSQIYTNWELCIVNDASKNSYVKPFLDSLVSIDKRVKVSHRETNGHISQASNDAARMAEGDFLVLLDHDDLLRPHSLLRNAQKINDNEGLQLIYSDEDKLDEEGARFDHYFKPDWNPDLFLSQNYLCHLTCISREAFVRAGGFRTGVEGSQDWDLLLRVTEQIKDEEIGHIAEILYHWRATEKSTAKALKAKDYVLNSSLQVANEALERRKEKAVAEISDPENGYLRIKYFTPENPPLVSIIIPTKDRLDLIARCMESILEKTSYGNYEIIVLDHESSDPPVIEYFRRLLSQDKVRFINVSGEFNYSKINNLGAKQARGEILLFLNNDIEVIDPDWLNEMVTQTIRPEIGCVGAKLLYPNNKVQHGGVIMGLGGVAGHSHKHFHSDDPGYKHRLKLVQNYSAVTAACLSIRKSVFEEVGGFNEKNLKVAFNDVDLCLKVKQSGYRNLWTPYSVLIHHESASRGRDDSPDKITRFHREILYLKKKWQGIMEKDPCYNSNLTLKRENFGLRQKKKERNLVSGKTNHKNFLDCRKKLYGRLSGNGIEVGAFEHPAKLSKNCSVSYCDAITTDQAREIFPEIKHEDLNEVDHVIDLDKSGLETFGDESKDFIIINHVLEHLLFPDLAISECHRVLKLQGFLILAIPDKFHTFDLERSITSSKSIFERKKRAVKEPTPEDYFPVLECNHPKMLKKDAQAQKEFLKKLRKRREHLNIWDTLEFKAFFDEVCRSNQLNFRKIKEFSPNTNNFEYACLYEKA